MNRKEINIKHQIYLSSMVFDNDIAQINQVSKKRYFPIEFSSGIPYDKMNIKYFLNYKGDKLIHNYFPAHKIPFVINLASSNNEIRKRSISHCIKSIKTSAHSGSSFYSAHAGFLIDPNLKELGNKMKFNSKIDVKKQKLLFIDSIEQILLIADKFNIDFFIENNVLASYNYSKESANIPFFCCESNDIISVFKKINHPRFGLLLDTGHLKVSCKTLNFKLDQEFGKIKHLVKAIHHSDNNGLNDSNDKLTENYWFLKYLYNYKDVPNVIEVKKINLEEINYQFNLLKNNF